MLFIACYLIAALTVIGDFTDPHAQHFLSGHTDNVTCLALSPSVRVLSQLQGLVLCCFYLLVVSHQGEMIASGEAGVTADVIVWDVLRKRAHYRFEEHDHGVECLAFSHDERSARAE